MCSDDSNVSRVHYQDAVEHWWKQSGRGVKHSEINDIPPRVVNDDDSIDDECPPDYDAVDEPAELPPDIANMDKEKLLQAVDEELDKQTSDYPDHEPTSSGGLQTTLTARMRLLTRKLITKS